MRLHRLEVVGVGPFRDPQAIAFDPLTDSGLFLIDGPTGAGKTTLIDAITFALFGTVAGRESDSSRLRSAYCSTDDPTEVVLEFSVQGRRHRIARSPEYTRAAKRKTDSGITTQRAKQNLTEFDAVGNEILQLTSAQDIGIHVQRLLGMDADQFRQLVVLPQGEFADLLQMNPRTRLAALETLLGSRFFTRVQEELVRQAEQAREARREADDAVRSAAQAIASRVAELTGLPLGAACAALTDDEADDAARRAALEHIQASVADAAGAATRGADQARARRDEAQRVLSQVERVAAAVTVIAEADAQLHQAFAELAVDAMTGEQVRREEHILVEQRSTLRVLRDWEADAPNRAERRRSQDVAAQQALRRVRELEEAAESLPRRIADLEVRLGHARAQVDHIDALNAQIATTQLVADALAEQAQVDASAAVLEQRCSEATQALAKAKHDVTEREQSLDALHAAQLAQRAGQLARELIAGAPCPVCGATDHPAPAASDAPDVAEEREDARRLLAAKRAALTKAEERHEQAMRELQEMQTRRAELAGRIGAQTPGEIREALASLREKLAQAEALDIAALTGDLTALQQVHATLHDDDRRARAALAEAEGALSALNVAEQEQQSAIARIAGPEGTATQALANVEARLAALDRVREALDRQAQARAGLDSADGAVDPTEVGRRLDEAAAAFQAANAEADRQANQAAVLSSATSALEQRADDVRASLDERETVLRQVEVPVTIADIATARSPANRRKLTLASYAVQLRFAHVLESASLHLERMSAGQYSFQLSEGFRGREQAGLGIEVLDSWTGQARDPRSLSGGETFYASLALALGLADVVSSETGGAQLETLFVDEGFGSLDQDTLQLVLDQLDQLRSGGRVVGVISHVTEMKERIPDRIHVRVLPDHTSAIAQIPAVVD